MHEKYQDFDSLPFQLLQGLTIAFDPLNASNKEDSGDLLQVQPEKGELCPNPSFNLFNIRSSTPPHRLPTDLKAQQQPSPPD